MTNKGEQISAKIIPFPARRSAERGLLMSERMRRLDPASLAAPRIDVDGAWYHQAEIEKETPRRDN